jgi:hypothetical protein
MLAGGSGAGGFNAVPSGNAAGTGTSVNFLRLRDKTFAYGYSGSIGVTNAGPSTMLKFTLGSEILKIDLVGYSTHASAHGDDIQFVVKIDNQIVGGWIIESTNSPNTPILPTPFIIAPYTKVEITAENLSGSTSRDVALTMTGEAYA